MNETLKTVIDLILQWGPSVVSIITMICTVLVALKQVKNANKDNLEETRRLSSNTSQLMHENAELKKELRKILKKIHHIKDKEGE